MPNSKFTKHLLDIPGYAPDIVSLPTLPLETLQSLCPAQWSVSRRTLAEQQVMVWHSSAPYAGAQFNSTIIHMLVEAILKIKYDVTTYFCSIGGVTYMDFLEFDHREPRAWAELADALAERQLDTVSPMWLNQFCPHFEAEGVDENIQITWERPADQTEYVVNYPQREDGPGLILPATVKRQAIYNILLAFVSARPRRPYQSVVRLHDKSSMYKMYENQRAMINGTL